MMRMFETMIRGMYESGIRPKPYRTNGKPDSINGKLDALIEGQKGMVTTLNEGFKETNDILQEILKKIEIRYPNGVAQT